MSARDPLARPLRAVPACVRARGRGRLACRGRCNGCNLPRGGVAVRLAVLAGRGLDRVVVRVLMAASRIGTTPTPERTTTPPASSDGRAIAESLLTGRRIDLERERPTCHPRSLAPHSRREQTRCTAQQSLCDCCVRDTADERPRERRTRRARSRVWTLSDLGIDRHPSSERSARLRRRSRAWPAPIQFVGRSCTLRVNTHMNRHRAWRRRSPVGGMVPLSLLAGRGHGGRGLAIVGGLSRMAASVSLASPAWGVGRCCSSRLQQLRRSVLPQPGQLPACRGTYRLLGAGRPA